MEKTLTIWQPVTDADGLPVFDAEGNPKVEGRRVRFRSTGAYLLRYKAQFGRDAIQDVFKLIGAVGPDNKIKDISALDMETFYHLVWVLAKTADPTIPEPMEWLDSFSEFPLLEILPEVVDLITSCMTSTVAPKKK